MNLKRKLNLLEKLKEERCTKEQKLRFGVKPRWTGNTGYSFFRELRESLSTSNQTKIDDLKRSVII
ncbi:hypothetical protein N8014_04930 [Pseudomonadota bacterium]|nr:hypothetical protein [Pseudomonadota bacterium]